MAKVKNIAIYTYDTYSATFPENSWEDYVETNEIGNVLKKVFTMNEDATSVKFVVYDQEYLDWIKKMKMENEATARKDYMRTLTEKKLVELWEKYGLNNIIAVHSVPVELRFPHASDGRRLQLKIDEDSADKIAKHIEKKCKQPKGSIFVLPDLLSPNNIYPQEPYDKIYEVVSEKMINDNEIDYNSLSQQECPSGAKKGYYHLIIGSRIRLDREVPRKLFEERMANNILTHVRIEERFFEKYVEKAVNFQTEVLSPYIGTVDQAQEAIDDRIRREKT